ncbi:hypothetical protein I4U23_031063 [Adineta vaga]|nr:hypothetical protein I4U23_031063 [Adineta vaga]
MFPGIKMIGFYDQNNVLNLVSYDDDKRKFFPSDGDEWKNDLTYIPVLAYYDPHISLIYAEEKACNDKELINRIDHSKLIDKIWQGGKIQLVDTSGKLSE